MVATTPPIFSVDSCLSGLMLPAGSVRTWMSSTIHASTGWPAWARLPSHQFLGGWVHVFEALPEGDDGEARFFEVLAHLDRIPSVERDLTDVQVLP